MKVDITQLLVIFDELLTFATDEELGIYWFRFNRIDNLIITLSFSIYENYVGILICNSSEIGIAHVHMKTCSEIRVLDESKKQLEIVHENKKGRCFLDLLGNSIVNYDE